eukprot:TRINITY_DN310_c0_g2_i1.p1 TRINITY_DN310_c0_g2~~TRINITY_DN310_c0_g2_i1.p1  ORF type:complete len:307 (+),score=66.81 TRINITY_DN310_c0_g2_i1:324-1244(+)
MYHKKKCDIEIAQNETSSCPDDTKICLNKHKRIVSRVPPKCDFEACDECGGCEAGQICVDTGIRCVTNPCPTWECQTDPCFEFIWPPKGTKFCSKDTDCMQNTEFCTGCMPSSCSCSNGQPMICTMDCRQTCQRKQGSACLIDKDCSDGFECKNGTCGDPCKDWHWPPSNRRSCQNDSNCRSNEVCQGCLSSKCSCLNGKPYECTRDCGLYCQLKKDAVCQLKKHNELSIMRMDDCASGLVCLPIGNEIYSCQHDHCADWSWPPKGTRIVAVKKNVIQMKSAPGAFLANALVQREKEKVPTAWPLV